MLKKKQWCLWCLEALGTNMQRSENKNLFVTVFFVFFVWIYGDALLNIKVYIVFVAWGEEQTHCAASQRLTNFCCGYTLKYLSDFMGSKNVSGT